MKKNTRKQQKMIHFACIYSCILEKIKEKYKNSAKMKEIPKTKENQEFTQKHQKYQKMPENTSIIQFT